MKIPTFYVSAAILSLAVMHPAHATDTAPKSQTVEFADLDLNKVAGAATLFKRIRGAAQAVCGGYLSGTTLRDQQRHDACMSFAVSNAVAEVDEPMLMQYVANRRVSRRQATIASNH
jgi:UrcA family protein